MVDVIIPCFNGARYLRATLEAVLGQTWPRLRVLLVDDGSTDGSRSVVASYRGRIGYVFKHNGGQASARNLGLRLTSSPYVCLVDADDLPRPTMVQRLVERLEAAPRTDLAHGRVLAVRGDDVEHPASESWRPDVDWPSYVEPLSLICALHGSATMVRRSAFDRFGLFPESRRLQGCEDWHFWLQAVVQGARVERVPEALCLYRLHPGSSSADESHVSRREAHLFRAAAGLFERHRIRDEARRSVLAVGTVSLAARRLAAGDRAGFDEAWARGLALAPVSFRERWLSGPPPSTAEARGLLHLRLAESLLDLGPPPLAAAMFLRCRTPPDAAGTGGCPRIMRAMSQLVASERDAPADARLPSWASHVAVGLAVLENGAGRRARARVRMRQALRLDPANPRGRAERLLLRLPASARLRPALLELRLRLGRIQAAVAQLAHRR